MIMLYPLLHNHVTTTHSADFTT